MFKQCSNNNCTLNKIFISAQSLFQNDSGFSGPFLNTVTLRDMVMIPVLSKLFPSRFSGDKTTPRDIFSSVFTEKKYYVIVLACAESVNRQPD